MVPVHFLCDFNDVHRMVTDPFKIADTVQKLCNGAIIDKTQIEYLQYKWLTE